jgi:hypothetical protein
MLQVRDSLFDFSDDELLLLLLLLFPCYVVAP